VSWVKVPSRFTRGPRLSISATLVYLHFINLADDAGRKAQNDDHVFDATIASISAACSLARSTTIAAVKDLVEVGHLRRSYTSKGRHASGYSLTWSTVQGIGRFGTAQPSKESDGSVPLNRPRNRTVQGQPSGSSDGSSANRPGVRTVNRPNSQTPHPIYPDSKNIPPPTPPEGAAAQGGDSSKPFREKVEDTAELVAKFVGRLVYERPSVLEIAASLDQASTPEAWGDKEPEAVAASILNQCEIKLGRSGMNRAEKWGFFRGVLRMVFEPDELAGDYLEHHRRERIRKETERRRRELDAWEDFKGGKITVEQRDAILEEVKA